MKLIKIMLSVIALLAVGTGCANKNDVKVAERKNTPNSMLELSREDEMLWDTCSKHFNAEKCNDLGVSFQRGDGVKQSYKRAVDCYELACDKNYALACRNAGSLYFQRYNHKIDEDLWQGDPEEFFQKACNLDDAAGCNDLGIVYESGLEFKNLPPDFKKANAYYEKACNMGNSSGCSNRGFLYANGYGVKQDYKKANTYYDKACNMNSGTGCFNLGVAYEQGYGVKQDYKKANTYYEKSCTLNNSDGCLNSGVFYGNGKGVKQNYGLANIYYEKACNLNNGGGCNNLGVLYAKGQGVVQSKTTAKGYYRKACDLGEQLGCNNYRGLNEQDY